MPRTTPDLVGEVIEVDEDIDLNHTSFGKISRWPNYRFNDNGDVWSCWGDVNAENNS